MRSRLLTWLGIADHLAALHTRIAHLEARERAHADALRRLEHAMRPPHMDEVERRRRMRAWVAANDPNGGGS